MMIAPNLKQVCEQAKLYYYDFLFQKDKSEIPEHVLRHIRQCENCREQIYQLKTALTQVEQPGPFVHGKPETPLTNMLKQHFSYIEQDITCTTIKPFLPGMLNTSMQISIPTPITTHLDHCPECVNDLKKISDLDFRNANLSRLSGLFKAQSEKDNISCSRAKSDIMAFVMMAFHESDEQILKHLCTCSKCSTAIYQYRELIREELMHGNNGKPCFLSNRLSYDNIFDFAIPYGLDISQYQKSESLQSRVSHIRRCPFCLGKIQEFHNIIRDVSKRTDSITITKYNIEEPKQTENEVNSKDLYAGFPIHVEVSGAYKDNATVNSGSTINFTAALKHKILAANFRTISKTGFVGFFVIAAVLLTAMFLHSPNAKAELDLAQLYSSIEKVNNVHISSFTSDSQEPTEEEWISRTSNMKISKNNDDLTLLDITSGKLIRKQLNSEFTKTDIISRERLSDIERAVNTSLGLVPFNSVSDIPPGADWEKIPSESQNIYELINIKNPLNDSEFIKYRFILKTNTNLPVKVEFYRKLTKEGKYLMETYQTFESLSDEDFTDIKNSYFP